MTDIVAITKGYGWQGVIKRFGGKLQSHKNSKKRRQHGNMGAFGDGYVRRPFVRVDKRAITSAPSTTSASCVANPKTIPSHPLVSFITAKSNPINLAEVSRKPSD